LSVVTLRPGSERTAGSSRERGARRRDGRRARYIRPGGVRPDGPRRGLTEELFRLHCVEIEHGRVTGEKELQSFLIRESYSHGRVMQPVVEAAKENGEELDLLNT
jgi:hypothetical protein